MHRLCEEIQFISIFLRRKKYSPTSKGVNGQCHVYKLTTSFSGDTASTVSPNSLSYWTLESWRCERSGVVCFGFLAAAAHLPPICGCTRAFSRRIALLADLARIQLTTTYWNWAPLSSYNNTIKKERTHTPRRACGNSIPGAGQRQRFESKLTDAAFCPSMWIVV